MTTAGGSRTVSFFEVEEEILDFKIKNSAFWIDFETYLSHNGDTVVIVDHSDCGFWPEYIDDNREKDDHIKSMQIMERTISKKYPKVKRIILLYVVLDKSTDEVVDILEISDDIDIN